MLIEQAIHSLPEILTGSKYPLQDYEAGIVAALTMAVLQELNGRNVMNPLSLLQGERLYRQGGFKYQGHATRYLRADLVLKLSSLTVGSLRLSRYGWRHQNWLEAKFFRDQVDGVDGQASNATTNTAQILADLLRLALLIPEVPGQETSKGRYFLHVYDARPERYVAENRNKVPKDLRERTWVKEIRRHGPASLRISNLDREPATFRKVLGPQFPNLTANLEVRNYIVEPVLWDLVKPHYWCILTRIESVNVELNGEVFEIRKDRMVVESRRDLFNDLRKLVATTIGIPPNEEKKPEEPGDNALQLDAADPAVVLDEIEDQGADDAG